MNPPNMDPLAETLVYEDRLPIAWRTLDAPLRADALERLNRQNEAALRLIWMRTEGPREPLDEPGGSGELAQIDFKLSVLMDLVGELLAQQLELPAVHSVRLGFRGLEWEGDRSLAPGSLLLATVFLDPRCPRPLELPGRIYAGGLGANHNTSRMMFEGLSESVENWLEKVIFRHHRRIVAQQRARLPSALKAK